MYKEKVLNLIGSSCRKCSIYGGLSLDFFNFSFYNFAMETFLVLILLIKFFFFFFKMLAILWEAIWNLFLKDNRMYGS